MRKFGAIFKEKQTLSEKIQEQRLLKEFKDVYSTLLESYEVSEFHDLDDSTQNSFLTELNKYWTEEEGLLPRGQKFLESKQNILTESSTVDQKKDFFRRKAAGIISETFRQTNLKTNIYTVLDKMYNDTKSKDINEVMTGRTVVDTLFEAFGKSLDELLTEIYYELTDEQEEINEREFSREKRNKLVKSGEAMDDGSYPIVNKQDLKNAIKAFGRAGTNKAATKKHIMKRAKALGAMNLIPDKWK